MLKWKLLQEYDKESGTHTRFQIVMFGDIFQLRLEDNGTYTILKKKHMSTEFIAIKDGLLGLKPAKKYFARYILPKLTSEQTLDEIIFMEFEIELRSARRKAVKAREAERYIFSLLDDMCIDADGMPPETLNADTLAVAISSYLQHGKFSLQEIMREVRAAYGKESYPAFPSKNEQNT